MSNGEKRFEILKVLQESMKLDRSGVRLGWSESEKQDAFIGKMEFTAEEIESVLEFVRNGYLGLTQKQNDFLRNVYNRMVDLHEMLLRCDEENRSV